jgi:hypothetical protein
VLRAKVSVLVDLWEKNRRVRSQAALTASYERRMGHAAQRVDEALALVRQLNQDAGADRERIQATLSEILEQVAEDLE